MKEKGRVEKVVERGEDDLLRFAKRHPLGAALAEHAEQPVAHECCRERRGVFRLERVAVILHVIFHDTHHVVDACCLQVGVLRRRGVDEDAVPLLENAEDAGQQVAIAVGGNLARIVLRLERAIAFLGLRHVVAEQLVVLCIGNGLARAEAEQPGKAAGGYCTSLWDYQVPFIFANFNGTQHDVEVVTHEAGHAFAAYTNRDRVPYSTVWPSMEGCEVHSMSMEFFAWPWAEGFFGKDTRKFLYSHLAGALTFIPYGTMVDHFQHIVYEKPGLTPAERHAAWKELLGIYMPWMKLDGEIPFYSEGEGWQRQKHIYESPFYYIDYCLAQTVSLQFWAMLQKDRANAWEHYMAYTRQGGSRVFTELLKNAGLDSPFEESCLCGVCETAKQWLDNYDLTGIE